MAKVKQSESTKNPPRFWWYCFTLILLGIVVLAWFSLLTFSPDDPPNPNVIAPNQAIANRCGIIGAHFAWQLRYWFGIGIYGPLVFLTAWSFFLLAGKKIKYIPWRIAGLIAMAGSISAAAWYFSSDSSNQIAIGNAHFALGNSGVFGEYLGGVLDHFGTLGKWLCVIVVGCIGLMLSADSLVSAVGGNLLTAFKGKSEQAKQFAELRKQKLAEKRQQKLEDKLARKEARKAELEQKKADKLAEKQRAAELREQEAKAKVRAIPTTPVAKPQETPTPTPAPIEETQPVETAPQQQMDLFEEQQEPEEKKSLFSKLKKEKPAKPKPKAKPAPAKAKPVKRINESSLPSMDLLAEPQGGYNERAEIEALQRKLVLQQFFEDFNVQANVEGFMTGPVITLFEVALNPGVKVSAITNLSMDIARSLAVPGVRIVPPRFGKSTVGIEIPNLDKEIVRIKELMHMRPEAANKMSLPLYLGKNAGGEAIVTDLATCPHMLIAGTTGSGKSVCINTIIISLLLTKKPKDVRFILVDPKMVEMAAFEKLPHLLCPTINDMKKAESILEWATVKMDERYELLREAGVKNISDFNELDDEDIYECFGAETPEDREKTITHMPYTVIIIDEMADMMMTSGKEVESYIIRIAQKARAVGIHLVLATQRPSANVVTGLIKSNMPCRVSFRVASGQESRIVLDQKGAEVLLGQGDMLVLQPGTSTLERSQGTWVSDKEIRKVVKEIEANGEQDFDQELVRMQNSSSEVDFSTERDDLFDTAVEIILSAGRGSVSLLQRRLQIGYGRSSRIIDQMAAAGILGEHKGSQARECMMTLDEWQDIKASQG